MANFKVLQGDCREVLKTLADSSIDSVVTDPPYELGFMGKGWDRSGIAYSVEVWRECLRVLKPGGHLLAFGGSRTYHRLACAIEDAGFEIRDQIQWIYGSGFPKSLNISKQIDLMERDLWLDIKQLIEELDHGVIIEAWNTVSSTAGLVDSPSVKNRVAVGSNTQTSASVPAGARLSINPKRLPLAVIIAELKFCEAQHLSGAQTTSARENADTSTEASLSHAVSADLLLQNQNLNRFITASIAQCGVKVSLNERAAVNLTDEEALKIWLGKKKCLDRRDTDALCAGLIDGLKLTILSQSKTFQNLDTQSQTECVSAMTVTTTASTAASLISFTVDTLRSVAINAAAGAERQSTGVNPNSRPNSQPHYSLDGEGRNFSITVQPLTAPATDAAKQWNGWGTALKPAHEPIVLARKPLIGTVAENVLQHGTGGLNIDGCRVELTDYDHEVYIPNRCGWKEGIDYKEKNNTTTAENLYRLGFLDNSQPHQVIKPNGRWPANVITDGSEEVLAGFPETISGRIEKHHVAGGGSNIGTFEIRSRTDREFGGDAGSAARFFYCAKASKGDREDGLDSLPLRSAGEVTDLQDGSDGLNSPRAGAGRTNGSRNHHPTVKPTELTRYLCRLITPPKGTILDPFCGSGSTGRGAVIEKFNFIGIDLDAEYCQIARLRIEAAIDLQGSLFDQD